MTAEDFREALGFTGPYPNEAQAEVVICGRQVYLLPKTRNGMEMRVWTPCPDCGRLFNPGKLRQHMAGAGKRERAKANRDFAKQKGSM